MTKLVLGVVDIPYSGAFRPKAKKIKAGQRKFNKNYAANMTTGDVAEILEDKYAVMECFFTLHEADIARDLEEGIGYALEAVLSGAPTNLDAFGAATQQIDARFKDFLTNREMDGLGRSDVPTGAAKRGVNHRMMHPYAKANSERPSFIDTGLYETSMKSWVDK